MNLKFFMVFILLNENYIELLKPFFLTGNWGKYIIKNIDKMCQKEIK